MKVNNQETRPKECSYHLCRKRTAELSKCNYCGKFFCQEHLRAKPAGSPRFENPTPEERAFMDEWHRPGGHPCIPYISVWQEERKQETNRYAQALERLTHKSEEIDRIRLRPKTLGQIREEAKKENREINVRKKTFLDRILGWLSEL